MYNRVINYITFGDEIIKHINNRAKIMRFFIGLIKKILTTINDNTNESLINLIQKIFESSINNINEKIINENITDDNYLINLFVYVILNNKDIDITEMLINNKSKIEFLSNTLNTN